jgi:RecB family endonuclease NucS
MSIYELTPERLVPVSETSFGDAGVRERDDLQRLLREQVEIIAPGTLVIAEEFANWDDSRRRIDLLGIDKQAHLVVIELKRTETGGHMELQAIRYAAMVSQMTFEQAVQAYTEYLDRSSERLRKDESHSE